MTAYWRGVERKQNKDIGETHNVVERDRVYDAKLAKVVFVRGIVAMPGHDVERGVVLRG